MKENLCTLTDNMFVKEMQILWQNNVSTRELLSTMILDYFKRKRAKLIINKIQGSNAMIIKRLFDGWYNFETMPQENRYIKIANLRCGTDRKAINQARKILGDKKVAIKII